MQNLINFKRTISLVLVALLSLSFNVSAHKAHKATFQTANGIDLTGAGTITAGTMVRTRQSVDARLALSGLDTNSAYSVWWVVFNKPENCMDPIAASGSACGEADVPDSVFYAAGFVTDNSGSANITVHLNAGKLPVGLQVRKPGVLKRGKGFKAEFHMIVQLHGPISADNLAEQIGLFMGGCSIDDINNKICKDQAAIIFPPAGH